MAKLSLIQTNFTAGELSPSLLGMINTAIISMAGFGYSLLTGQKDDEDSYAKFYIASFILCNGGDNVC